jgi:asparagine synthetase B (glutamine-hydrolysing)
VDVIARHGPDAEGVWIAPHVALGHRRLPMIDIEGGRQPMRSSLLITAQAEGQRAQQAAGRQQRTVP